ncbi:MAG: hypothetical protein KatS3mg115_0578 [Candidatus Poribacteria bacterium]|nr:MAG: hypothetical protein KatS3mg115_0578 [Candidatus Poribacteria bacterium]
MRWTHALGGALLCAVLGCSAPTPIEGRLPAPHRQAPLASVELQLLPDWSPSVNLGEPYGIAVDRNGTVYLSDYSGGRLLVLSEEGNLLAELGAYGSAVGELGGPGDLCLYELGTLPHLYIAERENRRVQRLIPSRAQFEIVLPEARGILPRAIGVGRSGRLYVLDGRTRRVWRFAPDGAAEPWGAVELIDPSDLAVGQGEALLIADPGQGAALILDFTGALQRRLGAEEGLHRPTAAAADRFGRWYLWDAGRRRLFVLDPAGDPLGELQLSAVGEIAGMSVANNTLWMTDGERRRLLRIRIVEKREDTP